MEILSFIGLSISPQEARRHLDARFFGPVSGGDIPALVAEYRPIAIGVVDGVFHTRPAVLHKDILHALSRGVAVFGSSSIGALRAAELERHGMVGVGEIYRRFSSGDLEGDDEVAVPCVFLPGGGWRVVPGYEPMINIRATLENATRRGVISGNEASRLVEHAKAMCFTDRRWSTLLKSETTGIEQATLERLAQTLSDLRVDLKKADAVCLLKTIAGWVERETGREARSVATPDGPFWDACLFSRPLSVPPLEQEQRVAAESVPLLGDLLDFCLVEAPTSAILMQDALIRTLLLEIGTTLGVVPAPNEVEACRVRIVECAEGIRGGLAPLDDLEIQALAAEEAVCERLLDHYTQLSRRALLLTLLVEGRYGPLKETLLRSVENSVSFLGAPSLPSETEARETIVGHLTATGVHEVEDYFNRYVNWLPAHRLRVVASWLRLLTASSAD